MKKKKNKNNNLKSQNHHAQKQSININNSEPINGEQAQNSQNENINNNQTQNNQNENINNNQTQNSQHKNINNLVNQSELIKLQKQNDNLKRMSKESEMIWRKKIQTLEQDKIDLKSELTLTNKHLSELTVKYEVLIQGTAKENNVLAAKITGAYNKIVKKFCNSKNKIPFEREKRELKLHEESIDEDVKSAIASLEACNCTECLDLHQNTITTLQRVQAEFLTSSDNFISEKNQHDNLKVANIANRVENKHLKVYLGQIRRALADNWPRNVVFQEMIAGYEREIEVLTKGLKNENSKEWAVNQLTDMNATFKIFMKGFESKLELVLENINYADKYKLFDNWLKKLGDFVGKLNGKVALSKRLLSLKI